MGRNNNDFEFGRYTDRDRERERKMIGLSMSPYWDKYEIRRISQNTSLKTLDEISNHFKKAGTYTPEMEALKNEHKTRLLVPFDHPTIADGAVYDGVLRGDDEDGWPKNKSRTYPDGTKTTPVKLDHSACPFCDHIVLQHEDWYEKNQDEIQKMRLRSQQFSDQFFADYDKKPEDDIDREYRDLTDGN
jgi:hypothetical protein